MPKVSVIIPTYNCSKYIRDAIDSVLAQTYKDLEIIVIDDGSTDETKEVLSEYRTTIKYTYQENRGVAAARNIGMEKGEGEYIAFLDADDIWLPEKIEKQVKILDSYEDIGFVYCDNCFVDMDRRLIKNYIRKIKLVRDDILLDFFCQHFLVTSAVLLRKSCLGKVSFFNEELRVGEDNDFFLRLAYAYKAEVVEEKLLERRILAESLSRKNFILDAITDLSTLKRFLKQHPDFYLAYKKQIQKRLSDYYFSFAYNLLENGKNFTALLNLLFSMKYGFSLKAVKNILLCLLPFQLRKVVKEEKYAKS